MSGILGLGGSVGRRSWGLDMEGKDGEIFTMISSFGTSAVGGGAIYRDGKD